jgi:hypothetical protein
VSGRKALPLPASSHRPKLGLLVKAEVAEEPEIATSTG